MEQRNKLEQRVNLLKKEIESLEQGLSEQNDKYRVWNADVQKVKEAEAFIS